MSRFGIEGIREVFFRTTNDRERFLCICDILVADPESVTFSELTIWSEFICAEPIRSLFTDGRKLYTQFKIFALSADGQKIQDLLGLTIINTDSVADIAAFLHKIKRAKAGPSIPLPSFPGLNSISGRDSDDEAEEDAAGKQKQPAAQEKPIDKNVIEGLATWAMAMEHIRANVVRALDKKKIEEYISKEQTKENLILLGRMFETLGRYAHVLVSKESYGGLIIQYVQQFANAAASPATGLRSSAQTTPLAASSSDLLKLENQKKSE